MSAAEARTAAVTVMGDGSAVFDTHLGPWRQASLGEPLLVHAITGRPSYWLLPVHLDGRVIGLVRVSGTGLVFSLAALYRTPGDLSGCPTTPLGCGPEEAARRAAAHVDLRKGEVASPPVLVHDGPPGREAWLVEVRGRRTTRQLVVTASGVSELGDERRERDTA